MGIPVYPRTLLDALRREPDVPAFEHGSRVVARGELLDVIAGFVSGLRSAGVGPGTGVAIATATTPEGFAVQVAAHVVGCRVAVVCPRLTTGQLRHILDDVGYLLVDPATATPELLGAAAGCQVLTVGPDLVGPDPRLDVRGRPERIARIGFTSGITAAPKGVAFTYAAMTNTQVYRPDTWGERTRELADDCRRFLWHDDSSSAFVAEHLGLCLMAGGTAVIPAEPIPFPQVLLRLDITACLLTVPRLYRLLQALRDGELSLPGLRSAIVAGSPLPPRRLAEGFARLGPVLRQSYGQTETGTLTLLTEADVDRHPAAVSSVGRVGQGVRLEIRDAAGREVAPGGTGELWVRTPGQLCGYWDDEDETTAVLREGWVRTRDLGHVDGDGFVHLTGRARDIVIVNSVPHYAGPIERALLEHPQVAEAYVAGAPDEETGEAIHAIVVPGEDGRPDLESLCDNVSRELGEWAVPSRIHFLAEVPTVAGGKPDKRALLERVLD